MEVSGFLAGKHGMRLASGVTPTPTASPIRIPPFELWQAEVTGLGAPGSGVSCATCHLPRETQKKGDDKWISVQHNQNKNLQPNEKMIRGVCMKCHGLSFSIDALADPALIERNFQGWPSRHVESVDMAVRRAIKDLRRKEK